MKKIITGAALLVVLFGIDGSGMTMDESAARMKVFFTMTDRVGCEAVLKGKVISYSSNDEITAEDLIGRAQDKSKATVRLYRAEGIREGDTLYVVNDKNLVVAKMTVRTVFKSVSFGDMLVGYGNFRLGAVGDRVVLKAADDASKYAYIYKARGDYYNNIGSTGEAIREYRNALQADRNDPEAHLSLGLVYMKQGMDQFAMREFQESYRHIGLIYDNEDKFILLRSMAELRYREVYESFLPDKMKERSRKDGMKLCGEALLIYPESDTMHFYLGVFNYRSPVSDDKAARDHFLKAVEINPSHAEAYVALSELYYRHENIGKARMYAEKALQADHENRRARQLLNYFETGRQVK
ncbi:MAG: tetratricopeptide repeat protein [Spirochaetes bacterium]|nr:tetratricopeptide repeat protein [Spirochaetota bacterium]